MNKYFILEKYWRIGKRKFDGLHDYGNITEILKKLSLVKY